MIKNVRFTVIALIIAIFSIQGFAQNYTTENFVGTWHGTISSTNFGGYNDPITMIIYEDGFYTETSGHLMPSLYPNTQQFEYEASTNRLHWWYLDIVYAGQYFYQHFYYEIVFFDNNILEAHYNFWDDPEPHPSAGVIYLVKDGTNATPPPVNLMVDYGDDEVFLSWDEPENGGNPVAGLQGYNVYRSIESGNYELLDFIEETLYPLSDFATAGINSYYITALYDDGESEPSEEIFILFETPEPENLAGDPETHNISLHWETPQSEFGPMATLLGFNIFYSYEDEAYQFATFVEETNFVHENLIVGTHNYYVTAVYLGGESDPSNEIEVVLITTGINENPEASTGVYPNPAKNQVFISTQEKIRNISILNQAGQILLSNTPNENNKKLDVSSLATGLYLVLIETNEGLVSKKLIIE
jgi:hypothetical protein